MAIGEGGLESVAEGSPPGAGHAFGNVGSKTPPGSSLRSQPPNAAAVLVGLTVSAAFAAEPSTAACGGGRETAKAQRHGTTGTEVPGLRLPQEMARPS